MMPSFVTFENRAYFNHNILIFGVWNYEDISSIYVKSCKNGIVEIEAFEGTPIKPFTEFVAGIFHPESNFVHSIFDMYKTTPNSFKGIQFVFNGVTLTVTKEISNANEIYTEWKKQYKKLH